MLNPPTSDAQLKQACLRYCNQQTRARARRRRGGDARGTFTCTINMHLRIALRYARTLVISNLSAEVTYMCSLLADMSASGLSYKSFPQITAFTECKYQYHILHSFHN